MTDSPHSNSYAHGAVGTSSVSTPTLERAWCLLLVKSMWPTIDAPQAKSVADWMVAESFASGDR